MRIELCRNAVSGPASGRPVRISGTRLKAFVFTVILVAASLSALAAQRQPVRPGPGDKCPVCGMFVARYPDWTASIVFRDGSAAFFDGPKDMFLCYYDLKKYLPGKQQADVEAIFVSEYYDVRLIDARTAWYVAGSDVLGPMGRELVPFKSEADAREFLKDHQGTKVLRFQDVTREVVSALQ